MTDVTCVHPKEGQVGIETQAPAAEAPTRRVIIARRNLDDAEAVALLCLASGWTAHIVEDGAEALAALHEEQADMLVIDETLKGIWFGLVAWTRPRAHRPRVVLVGARYRRLRWVLGLFGIRVSTETLPALQRAVTGRF